MVSRAAATAEARAAWMAVATVAARVVVAMEVVGMAAARVAAARAVATVVALAVASSAATVRADTKVAATMVAARTVVAWVAPARLVVGESETARQPNARGLAGSLSHYLCTTSSRLKSMHMHPMATQRRRRQEDTCQTLRDLVVRG